MKKYIRSYKLGYNSGVVDACKDYKNRRFKSFNKSNDKELESMLYDEGYKKGYNKFMKTTFNSKKNIV